jgi:hypothetical protein
MPPSLDPDFWGRANQPYALTLTYMSTHDSGSNQGQPHVSHVKLYRDSAGIERTESFYDSGQPMSVMLRDPKKMTTTIMSVVKKTVQVISVRRPVAPPPETGRGWTVERLEPRTIAGFPAEGMRFTRTITNPDQGTGPITVVEEDWISDDLGIMLEQTVDNPPYGKTTRTVTQLEKVEPDPALFVVPGDYSVQQAGPPAH